jgi:hypothetical protein
MNGIKMKREPDLPDVAEQDRILVRNIIYMVLALNEQSSFCKEWNVQTIGVNYLIRFNLQESASLSFIDLQMIKDISLQRIGNIVIHTLPAMLSIHVLRYDQPVVVFEADIIRVSKRGKIYH